MNNKLLNNSVVALSLFISMGVFAYDAYNLHDDKWAVECKDGELASFTGDEKGLVDAGSSLCEANGGILGSIDNIVVKSLVADDSTEKAAGNEASIIVEGTENEKISAPSEDEMKNILENSEESQKAEEEKAKSPTREK